MAKKVVIVEGLISAGKTTLAQELGVALGEGTLTLIEPDEKDNANPYLADYYSDPKAWAFPMQIHLLAMRYRMHLHAQWHAMQGHGHAVLDRSYQGDTAFARLQLKNGMMSDREFKTYQTLYHGMTASVLLPTVCLHILVSPEVAQERIAKRMRTELGRDCESGISLEYLRDLDQEISHMISVLQQQGVTVYQIPWEDDRATPESRASAVDSIASRIKNLTPPDLFLDMHRRTL